MKIQDAQNIYCLGIGGIGVSALARLLKAMGKQVAGADLKQSTITDQLAKLGISVTIGTNQIVGQPDLVIYSPALPATELAQIAIPKIDQGDAVGQLMAGHYGIGITGTNGKSTTTAMLGLILEAAHTDPTVLFGSMLSEANESEQFRANARLGAGKYFVSESDEYHRKMLANHPQMIIITNVAEDHLDYYHDLTEIKSAFLQYVESLPADGILIYNADDHNAVEVCREAKCHKFTFGIHHYGDLQALNLKAEHGRQKFDLHLNDEKIGEFELTVPGSFNVSNALAASLAAIKLGVSPEVIKSALAAYAGLWRRFEVVGEMGGKPVISDYAHHPDAVAATIAAAKEFYPGKKILVVFQPHHRNRTKALLGEFVESLLDADEVIVPEIFDVSGRERGEQISSRDLVAELKQKKELSSFVPNLDEAGVLISEKISNFDVVLLMGAGDIDSLARKLVGNLK